MLQAFRRTTGDPMNGASLRRVFAWLLAIAAYATLVDLCAETFAAGSSLRWYALIVSVAFIAVSGLLWRSNDAGPKAEYAFIVIAALVAYAGWALGFGDARTLHAFGQPTSVVVAGMLVVAFAVSAAWLLLARGIPALLRFTVGALVLYARLPLVVALFRGGLDAALDGAALGVPGPFWSRGAYLGIELLLPLAIVAIATGSIVTLVRRNPRVAASAARIALALALVTQMGALEVATLDLPSLASFERPHGTSSMVAALTAPTTLTTVPPAAASPGAASGGGIGSALGGSLLDASDHSRTVRTAPVNASPPFSGKSRPRSATCAARTSMRRRWRQRFRPIPTRSSPMCATGSRSMPITGRCAVRTAR